MWLSVGHGLRPVPLPPRVLPRRAVPLDQQDPGRSALRGEWAVPGTALFSAKSCSGLVEVTGSGASSGGSWRRLRFNECTEQSGETLEEDEVITY